MIFNSFSFHLSYAPSRSFLPPFTASDLLFPLSICLIKDKEKNQGLFFSFPNRRNKKKHHSKCAKKHDCLKAWC